MSQIMNFLMITGAWALFLVIVGSIINWLSYGFFTTWFMVRSSRGKKWLVKVWTVHGTYYKAGKFDGKVVTFKDRQKQGRKVLINPNSVYSSYGVLNVEVDEEKNAVRVQRKVIDPVTDEVKLVEELSDEEKPIKIKGGFAAVQGFDAVLFDGMIKRALLLPQIKSNMDKIMIVLLVLLIIGMAWMIWQGMQLQDTIAQLGVISGGNVV